MSDHLRVGDLERDRATGRLAEHAAQGRLDPEERAHRARHARRAADAPRGGRRRE